MYKDKKMKITATLMGIFLIVFATGIGVNQAFAQCVSDEPADTTLTGLIFK
jgi:hypothetical protein